CRGWPRHSLLAGGSLSAQGVRRSTAQGGRDVAHERVALPSGGDRVVQRRLHAPEADEREFAGYARRIRQRLISLRRHRALPKWKVEPFPDIEQRLGQRIN